MNKDEFIQMHGKAAWAEKLRLGRSTKLKKKIDFAQVTEDAFTHLNSTDQQDVLRQLWKRQNLRTVHKTQLQIERNKIRSAHNSKWAHLKHQYPQKLDIHHSWVEGTTNYYGVALVERVAHRRGVIKVVQILEGQ